MDFHFAVAKQTLVASYDVLFWQIYKQLIQVCSWFIPFESECYMCEHPKTFIFADRKPIPASIHFHDGGQLSILG